jgi:hypothetical protein
MMVGAVRLIVDEHRVGKGLVEFGPVLECGSALPLWYCPRTSHDPSS